MKTLKLLLPVFLLSFFLPVVSEASQSVSSREARKEVVKKMLSKKKEFKADFKKEIRAGKKSFLSGKWFAKGHAPVDFNDPVDKWMWFWIFAWGIAIVIAWIPYLWYFSGLLGLLGTVCLVIWILKKTGNM